MSHRERCMAGVFSKILGHLGLFKDPSASSSSSSSSQAPQAASASGVSQVHPAPRSASSSSSCCCARSVAPEPRPDVLPVHCNAPVSRNHSPPPQIAPPKPPAGFRVRVSVPPNSEPFAPVVIQCTPGSGGVQGLKWYSEKLMVDEDGDVAQEFLDEVVSQASGQLPGYSRALHSFRLMMKTRPAKLKGPVRTHDGNVVQLIEGSTTYVCQSC